MITTERLILRHRRKTDTGNLYRYAKDDKTGPVAGWPVHTRVGNSRELFKTVLPDEETHENRTSYISDEERLASSDRKRASVT